jgi:predicted RNA-binding Zn-ribbon protein involved in translation (DUF1610 family)
MKSIIWKISKESLEEIVKSSHSYTEILRQLGLKPGTTTVNLKERMLKDNIDYSHIRDGQGCLWSKGKFLVSKEATIKYFCENSIMDRQSIKKYILRYSLIKYVCSVCGQEPFWKSKKLVLVLDHKNGVHNDHRIENLRFVCPNCNSQLPTNCRSKTTKNKIKRVIQLY